jgi:hypothetical protein
MKPEGSLPCSQEPYPSQTNREVLPPHRFALRSIWHFLNVHVIRNITLAVSRWIPTAEAQVRALLYGICGGQSGTVAGFLRVLFFPLPIIPPTASSSIIRGWYNRPVMADVPSGLILTPPLRKEIPCPESASELYGPSDRCCRRS